MLNNIGKYGCSCSLATKKLTLFVNTFFTIIILMFWIVGMVAWSEDQVTLSNAAWGHANYSYRQISGIGGIGGEQSIVTFYIELYAGLQGYYRITTSTGETQAYKSYHSYSDCNDTFCSSCQTAGQLGLGSLIISFFLTIPLVLMTIMRTFKDNSVLKFTSLLTSSIVWIFSVAAFSAYYNLCVMLLQVIIWKFIAVSVLLLPDGY